MRSSRHFSRRSKRGADAIYVPALRLKTAEVWSLARMSADAASRTTPLVVLTPNRVKSKKRKVPGAPDVIVPPPTLDEHVAKMARRLRASLLREAPLLRPAPERVFVDVAELDRRAKTSTFERFDALVATVGGLVPVVRVNYAQSSSDVAAAARVVARRQAGVALRLRVPRFGSDIPTPAAIAVVMKACGCSHQDADLVLDIGEVNRFSVASCTAKLISALRLFARAPWRSVTVLSGGFPKSLKDVALDRKTSLPRWCVALFAEVARAHDAPLRLGDYGPRHPALRDGGPGGSIPNVVYATDDSWSVQRQDVSHSGLPPYRELWSAARGWDEYDGADFSYGDALLDDIATGARNAGNSTTALKVAFSHHIEHTSRRTSGSG